MSTQKNPVGRRPTGIRPGEKVSEYKRLTVRMPDDVRAEIDAVARAVGRPQWRVLIDAVRAYAGLGPVLTDDEKRAVRAVLKLRQ